MRKQTFIFFILSFLFICLCYGQNNIVVTPVGKMDRAVSGHFAAIVDGKFTTWGGCNFPDVPCADGGQKVFYPKAYGASVAVPEGTVYIGGVSPLPAPPLGESHNAAELKSNDECLLVGMEYSPKGGAERGLPSLPKGLDNFAACYGVDRIFVAGGQTDGVPNRDVYALDWPDGKEWVKLCEIPDAGRLQPCMAVQNAPEGKALFIFGGYTAPSPLPLWGSAT
ncbi:MAG: hypothetical protein IKQ37_08660, partial [Bacteroidaceae bacterium]|nr:hypothetical protein [Bacteroidaceae bacterium]